MSEEQTIRRHDRGASIIVVDPSSLSLLALAGVLHNYGHECVCARTSHAAFTAAKEAIHDLVVWDVGTDAQNALDGLNEIREQTENKEIPAILIAENRWAGLEKKAESMSGSTCCLFKPIDPNSLMAVVERVLWIPSLVSTHRRRGTRPSRPGWVGL